MTKLKRYIILFMAIILIAPVSAGVANAAGWVAKHGMSSAQYQQQFKQLTRQGYRLKSVTGYEDHGLRYAALWVKESGPAWTARHGMTAAQYQRAFNDFASKGYRLTYINGYAVGSSARFAAIWEKRSGPAWAARHNMTAAQYQKAFNEFVHKGYRLVDLDGYSIGRSARFAAIFVKSRGPAWVARHNMSAAQYQQAFNKFSKQGYLLKVVSGYRDHGHDRYAALWDKSHSPLRSARHGIPRRFYQNVFDNYRYQSWTPVLIDAFASSRTARFNGIWVNTVFTKKDFDLIQSKMKAYMTANNVPGASIAITKNERLVFAAGFGVADKSTGEPVGPLSRFRIASVTKPFTSAAIMTLVQAHKLGLNDKVFGPGGILSSKFSVPQSNPNIVNIRIRDLLTHTAGFTTANGDPMFAYTGTSQTDLIKWALANFPLAVMPGTRYEYSNFGYCLLGRVIEAKTGMSYEAYVKQAVLSPSGVSDMVIGANKQSGKKPREVVYYGGGAYSNVKPQRFDSHGGWIATTPDMVRFLAHVDGTPGKPDILSAASHTTMTTAPGIKDKNGKDPNYAFAWGVGGGNQWHNGAMSGTIAVLNRPPNDFGYAGAANSRPANDQFVGKFEQVIKEIIAGVPHWPNGDLF